MNKIFLLSLTIGLIIGACSDPNTIGLEVQPGSDNIIINSASFQKFISNTESEDSLRTDEAASLVLGEISEDPTFLYSSAGFYTQILLTQNNIDLGNNPIVDSVVMSYNYSGYYGDLEDFSMIFLSEIEEPIYKDSIYYSTKLIDDFGMPYNFVESFILDANSEENPLLKIRLTNQLGQKILDFGNDILKDNETFLEEFYGLRLSAESQNTMLYLNPTGTNSFLKVYYHNDESGTDTLSLDFDLGGDAARINCFNSKPLSSLVQEDSKRYIQSMSGYKMMISINNIDSIKSLLAEKIINRVALIFDVEENSQSKYKAHDKLVLVRVNEEGDNVFLSDFINEGQAYFGGNLENDKYEFAITQYFSRLLNNESYTNDLYLLPAGAAINANRTILKKDIKLQIYYSEL
tara:strand:- start:61 stop:1275 length:1215 start_codon:yes stop_codon:yes gene_type:complete